MAVVRNCLQHNDNVAKNGSTGNVFPYAHIYVKCSSFCQYNIVENIKKNTQRNRPYLHIALGSDDVSTDFSFKMALHSLNIVIHWLTFAVKKWDQFSHKGINFYIYVTHSTLSCVKYYFLQTIAVYGRVHKIYLCNGIIEGNMAPVVKMLF